MTDEELITRGRELVSRRLGIQWELGELALEYAPIGDPSVKTGAYDRLLRGRGRRRGRCRQRYGAGGP